jgi:hypothetical protein
MNPGALEFEIAQRALEDVPRARLKILQASSGCSTL